MPIEECMDRHTHRQFLAWIAWLESQWNKPDRHDHYTMQLAATVKRLFMKDPRSISLNDFIISFKPRVVEGSVQALEEKRLAAKRSERTWLQFFGIVPEEDQDGIGN